MINFREKLRKTFFPTEEEKINNMKDILRYEQIKTKIIKERNQQDQMNIKTEKERANVEVIKSKILNKNKEKNTFVDESFPNFDIGLKENFDITNITNLKKKERKK